MSRPAIVHVRSRIVQTLVANPCLVTTAVVLGVALYWAAEQGGITPTRWPPEGLLLVLLAFVALVSSGFPRPRPRWVIVSVVAFAGFAAWNYASIAWAAVPADAWDGANKTLVYAVAYSLAVWAAWTARGGLATLAAFAFGVTAIGVVELVQAVGSADPGSYFASGRLAAPVGYQNANAALFLAAVWPLLAVAGRREAGVVARALAVGSIAALLELALLVQSRGSLVALPLTFCLFLVLTPRRLHTLLVSAVPVAATAAAAPRLLDVYRVLNRGADVRATLHHAALALLVTTVAAAVGGAAVAMGDARIRVGRRAAHRAGTAVAVLALAALVVGGVETVRSNGQEHLRHAWHEFVDNQEPNGGSSHFVGGLGSYRYDFWRVAARLFVHHPVAGVGSDNFATFYLEQRAGTEEPRYPHSVELRVLEQTGVIGGLLFVLALGMPVVGALRRLRKRDPAGRLVVAAGMSMFAYWFIHGSVDWFWEFPALSVPALVGLAIAARSASPPQVPAPATRRRWTWLAAGVAAVLAAAAAASITFPYLSARDVALADSSWGSDPQSAFADLRTARRLNPLSDQPDLTAGVIHSRRHEWRAMARSLRAATAREPIDWYAHMELAIADIKLHRLVDARRELARALALDPREPALELVRQGIDRPAQFDPAAVDRLFLQRVRALTAP